MFPKDGGVWVALGSNAPGPRGDPLATLEWAVARLSDVGLVVVKRSRWWRSAAWPNAGDPVFLNGVAQVETTLEPAEALARLHAIEAQAGRVQAMRNAPRPLDLDLVAWERRVETGPPELPHPRAAERLFVMGPLAELAPDWRHPVTSTAAQDLARRASVGADAEPALHRSVGTSI